jgi:hypothetical protein
MAATAWDLKSYQKPSTSSPFHDGKSLQFNEPDFLSIAVYFGLFLGIPGQTLDKLFFPLL